VSYNTVGDLVTLYSVDSVQNCCTACKGFVECNYYTYVKDPTSASYQQCVIKSANAKLVSGTNASADSGSVSNSYVRPTSCSQQETNTQYLISDPLSTITTVIANDCCSACSNYLGCNYWTFNAGTCYLLANLGSKTTANAVTSGTVIPSSYLSTPKRQGKRGVGMFGTESCSDVYLLGNVSWVYNWAESPGILEECYDEFGIQFIPMLWGATADFSAVYGNSPYLLTFNEPNFPQQSNLSPAQAAALWPQVEAVASKYGMQISSPSASYGGANGDPLQWLDEFFGNCTGCKVDFITTHQYDCDYNSLHGAVSNFEKYNKSVWVTEFSCYGANVSDEVTFVEGILPLFDNDNHFAKYAWFGARDAISSSVTGTNDIFNRTGNALTEVGVLYAGGPPPNTPFPPPPGPTSTSTSSSSSTASSYAPKVSPMLCPVILLLATLLYLL